ncbi:pantoate--beta-alanine ligase [Rothia nasimurium]|uniref:pantoate--beta-alanine ligase n=1 Tax=Rothia nasimurium TaxID=85336 RepID=UPI001F026C0D|nr:pantoate--beta-alanine ligase [Rothia nasimurium]
MTSQTPIAHTITDLGNELLLATTTAKRRLEASSKTSDGPKAISVGFVPTMGALHEGHATLIRRAREQNDVVVLSIFVNPLQFGPNEDYDRYPRTLEADAALASEAGVDVIFAPEVEEMYPGGTPKITAVSGELGTLFEGKTRPGHFDGVLTVVNKFFNILKPLIGGATLNAYFGQKDAQQLALIQRMVKDFNHDLVIKPVPVVRADDGLALSSRNQYLSADEREAALVLSRTLATLREKYITGSFSADDVQAAREAIDGTDGVKLDYLEVVDTDTFATPTDESARVLALVAAYVGNTRLIDNMDIN